MRWVLDHGAELTTPREAPDFIESKQAVCGWRPDAVATAADEGAAVGLSDDRTLSWTSIARYDGSRPVTVRMWDGSATTEVIEHRVTAPGQRSTSSTSPLAKSNKT